jgi:hypothetical protein
MLMMSQPRASRIGQDRRRRRLLHLLAVAVILAGMLVIAAPGFLICRDEPVRSDAVILISGPEMKAREVEARQLIKDGYARYILFPLEHLSRRFAPDADFDSRPEQVRKVAFDLWGDEEGISLESITKIYEDTHLEILAAKGMMSRLNLNSAIIVTYPYHLRRVKLIAGRVFPDNGYKLSYMNPRSIKVNSRWWFFKRDDSRWILGEYAKIAYYLAYTHLPFLFE